MERGRLVPEAGDYAGRLWLGFDFPAAGFVFAVGEAVAHGVEGVAGGVGGDAFFVDADAAVFEGEETDEGG